MTSSQHPCDKLMVMYLVGNRCSRLVQKPLWYFFSCNYTCDAEACLSSGEQWIRGAITWIGGTGFIMRQCSSISTHWLSALGKHQTGKIKTMHQTCRFQADDFPCWVSPRGTIFCDLWVNTPVHASLLTVACQTHQHYPERNKGSRAPSQYKDRLIYVWRFPC